MVKNLGIFRPWGVCFHLILLAICSLLVSWHHVDAICTSRKNGPRLWLEYRWNILGNRIIRVNWIISPNSSPYTGREYFAHLFDFEFAHISWLAQRNVDICNIHSLQSGPLRTSVSPLALSRFCQIPERAFSLSRAKPPFIQAEVTHLEQSFPEKSGWTYSLKQSLPDTTNLINQAQW